MSSELDGSITVGDGAEADQGSSHGALRSGADQESNGLEAAGDDLDSLIEVVSLNIRSQRGDSLVVVERRKLAAEHHIPTLGTERARCNGNHPRWDMREDVTLIVCHGVTAVAGDQRVRGGGADWGRQGFRIV